MKTALDAVVQLSDWHIGTKVNLADNQFNLAIANARLTRYLNVSETIISEVLSPTTPVNTIHIMLLGDFIHNETMRGSAKAEAEFEFPDQESHAADLILKCINFYAQLAPEVRCYGVVGNHGRAGRPGDNGLHSNHDYSVYNTVNKVLGPEHPACIQISRNKFVSANVCGGRKKVIGTHGDQVGGWGKRLPWAALTEMSYKAGLKYGGLDAMVFGHGHRGGVEQVSDYWLVCNPSLCGETSFTDDKCGGAQAGQALFFMHPEHGQQHLNFVNLQCVQGDV